MTQCKESTCPITNNMDITRSTPAEKKATAAALYATGKWTPECLAEKFGTHLATVYRWLEFSHDAKIKPAKTESNPRGAGAPPGKRTRKVTPEQETAIASARLNGKSRTQTAKELGLGEHAVQLARAREEGREEAEAQIDPETMLSKTAQEKLAIAIRQRERQVDLAFEKRVSDEVARRTAYAFPHLKAAEERAAAISASYTPRFSKRACQDVARCLHSDTWQSLNVPPEFASRLHTAFVTFTKMQKFLCVE